MTLHESPLARKLATFVSLTSDELAVLADWQRIRRSYAPGRDLIHQGQEDQTGFILQEGWVCSYKLLPGGTRQIVDFQIPGDFMGLRSILFRTADHNIEPVTPIVASVLTAADVIGTFSATPRIATAVLWAVSRDEAMVVEHLIDLGRRNAVERMAHFVLELGARLHLVGLATREGFACPLTQYHLADAMGLSAVHVNRVLRQLREDGLLTFQNGMVSFDNYAGLVRLADFDVGYLDHEGPILP